MKKDSIIASLINFLIPLTLLYAAFIITNIFSQGFFAVIYSIFIILAAYTLNLVKFINNDKPAISLAKYLNLLILFIKFAALSYLIAVLLLITNLFSI